MKGNQRLRTILFCATACGALTAPTQLLAQTTVPQHGQGAPDEIVVTAQKREQRLSDVGLAVVAASNEQLSQQGITNVNMLDKIAPGFAVGTTYTGAQVFSLRGVNFNSTQISASPAVSTYVDEAALPYTAMTGGLLLDVERVEVLKGPQGTLFGQNATAGSVNVIAAKPTSTFEAGIKGEVNHFGEVFAEGFVSGPITTNLNARLAGSVTQGGAWQRGYYLSNRKNGDQNKFVGRLLLDWTPTERLKVSFNVNGFSDRGEIQQYQVGKIDPVVPVGGAGVDPALLTYRLPNNNRDAEFDPGLNTKKRDRLLQAVGRIDYDLSDDVVLTSITNYADYKTRHTLDGDATVLSLNQYFPRGRIKTFSQELRLTGQSLDDRITYIVGGNYQKDKITDVNALFLPGQTSVPHGTFFSTTNYLTNRALGVFGNLDFKITDQLTLTGGARYTDTRQTLKGCTVGNAIGTAIVGTLADLIAGGAGTPNPAYVVGGCLTIDDVGSNPSYLPISGNVSQKEDNVSWRIGLNFKPTTSTLIYGLVSRGYKSGVFPVLPAEFFLSGFQPVRQEEVTSYEIGTKLGLFDRKLQFNVTAFYYDYRDKQFLTYQPYPAPIYYNQLLLNIPKSKVKGIDLDFVAYPFAGLTLRGALTYIDTKVGNFVTFTPTVPPQPVNVEGTQFNFAPKWSGMLDAEYSLPLSGSMNAYIGGNMQFQSRTFSDLGEDPNSINPKYTTFDARIGLRSEAGWTIGLFARNLTDKYYWTSQFRTSDVYARTAGRPRTFGVTAGYQF
ncbi:TonB-dependent receptor [Sphingobium chlorophenolicum L-1]|uniref:TonB-dependent receptor n=1 Tax=Sphingobium chlorophenolicum L-1 TaxID=690566 RepID=F6F373_SPHCR|nr:TonB-dependent receptor [Sphingobium chlorophenolicum]AEG50885.1 TonB-dependent receptor [Sphingobium chlorophenolicum L-1]